MSVNSSRLGELLDCWEDALMRGQTLSPEDLCAESPELLDELKQQIAALRSMKALIQAVARPEVGDHEDPAIAEPTHLATTTAEEDETLTVHSEYGGLTFHAQGGLGTVYQARDRRLRRDVALKFLHHRFAGDPASRQRLLLEAEITGRLEHPGIVPVHGVGEAPDGRLFYAMRFIRGETLEAAIRRFHQPEHGRTPSEQSLEFRDLLGRFVAVCHTLAYAHNRGIVHRDIKPQNVMLGRYGETLVVDWGLALPVGRDERARQSGEPTLVPSSDSDSGSPSGTGAGTPAYMSPEQAAGSTALGPASDVYGLGATLYKILTGEAPFAGRNVQEVVDKVKRGDFPRPREVRPEVPPALQAICLKAMALDPQDRYATSLELADDLKHWLGDEPVSAWREPLRHRWARWGRRHRTTVQVLLAGMLALIVVSFLAAVWLGRLANREHDARRMAEQAREEGLKVSARFAARTVAGEIDLRWRILEQEAADSELRTLLRQAEEPPEDATVPNRLQAWLNDRYIQHNDTTKATSWFVTDARGVQLARSPIADTIGERYHYRDYFHGLGRDLDPQEGAEVEPVRGTHHSVVFRSQASDNLMVAFSVPVWSGRPGTLNRRVLGVLAMTVELGRFSVLQSGLGRDQMAVLVDTRPDWIDQQPQRGLILHHPLQSPNGPSGETSTPASRLPADLVDRLVKLRHAAAAETERLDHLERRYHDPLNGKTASGHWLAAFEPVFVAGRPARLKDTGWIVIVQQRDHTASESITEIDPSGRTSYTPAPLPLFKGL